MAEGDVLGWRNRSLTLTEGLTCASRLTYPLPARVSIAISNGGNRRATRLDTAELAGSSVAFSEVAMPIRSSPHRRHWH